MIAPEARPTTQAWTVTRRGKPRFILRATAPTMLHESLVEQTARNAYGRLAGWRLGAGELGVSRDRSDDVVFAPTTSGALPVFDALLKFYARGPKMGQPYVAGTQLLQDWLRRCRESGIDTEEVSGMERWARAPRLGMVVPKPGRWSRLG